MTEGPTAGESAPGGGAGAADPSRATLQATRRLMWLLVVPVLLLLAGLSVRQYLQRLDDAERELLRRAGEHAQELEALARPAMAHVADLHELLRSRWNDPPDPGPVLARALQPHWVDGERDGWTLDQTSAAERQRFGQFWWESADGRPPDPVWVSRAALFNEVARVAHQRDPGFAATWFAAAEANSSFGYPWTNTADMLTAYDARRLRDIDKPRRDGVARAQAKIDRAPQALAFWGSAYVGQLDGQLVLSHVKMLAIDGRYLGEVSVDFRLAPLQRKLQQWRQAGRLWIVDGQGQVLADSAMPLQPPAAARADTRVQVALADRVPAALRAQAQAVPEGSERVLHTDGWVLVSARRSGSPWAYVQALSGPELRQPVWASLWPNAWLALSLLAVFLGGQWLLARRFVTPALEVLAYLRALSRDAGAQPPSLGRRWRVWIDAVTDTFRLQHELQRRERRTEVFKSVIVDNALSAIVTTDVAGHIVEFNPMAERLFRCSRESVLGRVLGDVLVPERHRAAHRAEMARLHAGEAIKGLGRPTEMRGLRADGSECVVEMLVVPIDFEGQVFYTGFISDLTERRAAAMQIERQREALRQSEKLGAMGSLLAGVAHELNNPLAIVMGRAHLLEDKTAGTPAADDARRIREAAERCGRIVRTFLNMARARPAQRRPVQLNELAQAAAELLGYTLRSHGIELLLELDEQLPPVQADPDQIGQVLLNLIVNAQQALAAIETGPRRIQLQSGRRQDGEPAVWLRVADSGPGLDPGTLDQVFEPFFTTKPEGIGTGLGLAVSRAMVREHGGDLVAEALPAGGRGASFLLTLPLATSARAAAAEPAVEAPTAAAATRVLVVDDEPEIADLLRALLEQAGYEVATAESGALALELLGEARFDAIVSDLRMPDMDGAALWRAVRERQPALAQRMLFVTGDTLSPSARSFLDEARCKHLEKPFAQSELLACVHTLLRA